MFACANIVNVVVDTLNFLPEEWSTGFEISHFMVLDHFFDRSTGFQHTLFMGEKDLMLIIYGYNPLTRKFVGVHWPTGPYFDRELAYKKYALPKRPYIVFEGLRVDRMRTSNSEIMQLPVTPLNKPI